MGRSWEKLLLWFVQKLVDHWVLCVVFLVLPAGGYVLGAITFGSGYKQRIVALEKQQLQPKTFNVAGDLITVDRKPVARFAQKFEMLDTVIPLSNGQILTFFAPTISVEYLNGDKEAIELPRATLEELVKTTEARIRENPERFQGWEPLRVKPDKLREMLKEHENDDP